MNKTLILALTVGFLLATTPSHAVAPGTVVSFTTMVGVEGAFLGDPNAIRGVIGDDLPWEVGTVRGSLTSDGHLSLKVTGIVFANVPSVPANLRGINDETQFRALVSCLSDLGNGQVGTINFITDGFPATPSGNSKIDTFVALPPQCVAPIVFVMSGSEAKWFAVTGAEAE